MQTPRKTLLPPHSREAEQSVLALALEYPETLAQFVNKPGDFFHDLRHATIFDALRQMHRASEAVDLVTLRERLKAARRLKEAGGDAYLSELANKAGSPANVGYHLGILTEKFALRKLQEVCRDADARISTGRDASGRALQDLLTGIQSDLDTVTRIGQTSERKLLAVWNAKQLAEYIIPADMQLVGDNEIVKGYEGIALLAGPGSSGKSLCAMALALAGARGEGLWMGRKVHRKFKTLIIQAENGLVRLKTEFEALRRNHPDLPLDEHIFITQPPEGGLPFHRGDFRGELRELVLKLQPDLVIVDPWSQVATEDAAKEVVDKLAEIRSCFPADNCPGLLIIAHTKKPRAEELRKGRGLAYTVSGSIALVNTARCVYMVLPWTDDPEDTRIYFSCPKLNNGTMYPASVWHRRFGTFFEHDDKTNPKEWGRSEDDREKITEDHLRAAFEKSDELQSGVLVKKLQKISGAGESTCWRAVSDDGYLRPLMIRSGHGKYKLKDPNE